ncbi:MAG: alpha/beta hydrolase, partial [Caldilineaceae bacterium]|nr:alpha/beta hydrolase [Caldilineaceae bacterium]
YERVNQRVWNDDQRRAFFRTFRGLVRWLPGQQKELPAQLAAVTTPTHVVWGELDRIAAVENGRTLAAMQPGAQLTIVPGAGHNIQQEAPAQVIETISNL